MSERQAQTKQIEAVLDGVGGTQWEVEPLMEVPQDAAPLEREELEPFACPDGHTWYAKAKELERQVAELQTDLAIARACKPDEFTHVVASERMAHSELRTLRGELEAVKSKLLAIEGLLCEEGDEFPGPTPADVAWSQAYASIRALKAELEAVKIHFEELMLRAADRQEELGRAMQRAAAAEAALREIRDAKEKPQAYGGVEHHGNFINRLKQIAADALAKREGEA